MIYVIFNIHKKLTTLLKFMIIIINPRSIIK